MPGRPPPGSVPWPAAHCTMATQAALITVGDVAQRVDLQDTGSEEGRLGAALFGIFTPCSVAGPGGGPSWSQRRAAEPQLRLPERRHPDQFGGGLLQGE